MLIQTIKFSRPYKPYHIIPPTFINFIYEWKEEINVIGISCNIVGNSKYYSYCDLKDIANDLEREFSIKEHLEELDFQYTHHYDITPNEDKKNH